MLSTNKKIYTNRFKKIYLMVPANVSTGGPEALHQLGFVLKNFFNKKVQIFYVPKNTPNPVHENYKKYSIDFTNEIEDSSDNLIIIPEYFNFLKITLNFKNIKKIIWWLSIDNYIGSRFRIKNTKTLRSIYKIPYNFVDIFNSITNFPFGIITLEDYLKFLYKFRDFKKFDEINQANFHLVQSHYAYDFLKNKFEFVDFLSDFIREDLLNNKIDFNKKKENIICYNPQKSNKFMNLFIKKNNFKFIPLINLNHNQIINILSKSKIYMDIGSHPGKDRMPREAVLLGNCILTNLKGSAGNSHDLSIPKEFKFAEKSSNLKNIKEKINQIFNNYDKEYRKFEAYKKKILNEKDVFVDEIKKLFI